MAGVVCLSVGDILSNVVFSVADSPVETIAAVETTAAVGAHAGLWSVAALLLVLGGIFFLPGLIGLVLTARGKGSRLTVIGGSMLGVGMVAYVAHIVHEFGMYGTWAAADLPASTVRSLSKADGAVVTTGLVVALMLLGLIVGTVLLMIGLRRGHRIPIWAAVAGVVYVIGENSNSPLFGVLELLAGLVAFVPAALCLVNRPLSHPRTDAAEHLTSTR